MKDLQGRDSHVDMVKTVAIFCVIVIHVSSGGWGIYPMGSCNWISNMFWASLTRAAVPLFLMCSGALLLDPEKELPLKKLYGKNLPRVIVAMFFWAFAYMVYHLIDGNQLSVSALTHAVKELLIFKHEFHLYYVHIIILVYVFLPITRSFVKNADHKTMMYALAVWFALGILYPTLRYFWPFNLITGFPVQWVINMSYSAIGYGILGYYIKHRSSINRRIYLLMLIGGFIITFGGTWIINVARGSFQDVFLGGMSVGTALMAAGFFGFLPAKRYRGASIISKASFCIYLVHVFFMYLCGKVGLTLDLLPNILSVPVITIAIFACSCGVYALLSRIPLVKKWLI